MMKKLKTRGAMITLFFVGIILRERSLELLDNTFTTYSSNF